ncbi:Putative pentatricopeptide repeat-containing protein At3g16890 [Durusdinium trenchii]
MLKSCSKAGDVPSAIRWLKEISKASLSPDVISWNCAIGACAASKPIESAKAEEFFRQFAASGLKPDGLLLRTLTSAVGPKTRRWLCEELEEHWSGKERFGPFWSGESNHLRLTHTHTQV